MANTWQTYRTRIAALLGRPAVRGSNRLPGRRVMTGPFDTTLSIAAHVVTSRVGYTHHGIYVGDGKVVHYQGLSRGWRTGPVEEVSLAEFARGRAIRVQAHVSPRFDRDAVVARARSRLGESAYSILSNNCEHFCDWCVHGKNRSRQIEELCRRPRRALLAVLRFVDRMVCMRVPSDGFLGGLQRGGEKRTISTGNVC
jgi:hypothetical protein